MLTVNPTAMSAGSSATPCEDTQGDFSYPYQLTQSTTRCTVNIQSFTESFNTYDLWCTWEGAYQLILHIISSFITRRELTMIAITQAIRTALQNNVGMSLTTKRLHHQAEKLYISGTLSSRELNHPLNNFYVSVNGKLIQTLATFQVMTTPNLYTTQAYMKSNY